MKCVKICSLALALLLTTVASARAQYPGGLGGPVPRPGISPYLQLNRGGNQAINYLGLVRPQIESQRAIQALNDNVNLLANAPALAPDQPSQTGIRSSFMTHQRFFMNNGGGPTRQTGAASFGTIKTGR